MVLGINIKTNDYYINRDINTIVYTKELLLSLDRIVAKKTVILILI